MRTPTRIVIVAALALVSSTAACSALPMAPAAPAVPTIVAPAPSAASPAPSASDAPSVTSVPAPTSTMPEADPSAPVHDCGIEPSVDLLGGAATVIGECVDVYVAVGGPVTIEHADALTVNGSEVQVTIGTVGDLIVNGTDGDVEVLESADTVDVNGLDHVVEAATVTTSVSVNGAGNAVTWTDGVPAASATANGDNVVDGP